MPFTKNSRPDIFNKKLMSLGDQIVPHYDDPEQADIAWQFVAEGQPETIDEKILCAKIYDICDGTGSIQLEIGEIIVEAKLPDGKVINIKAFDKRITIKLEEWDVSESAEHVNL